MSGLFRTFAKLGSWNARQDEKNQAVSTARSGLQKEIQDRIKWNSEEQPEPSPDRWDQCTRVHDGIFLVHHTQVAKGAEVDFQAVGGRVCRGPCVQGTIQNYGRYSQSQLHWLSNTAKCAWKFEDLWDMRVGFRLDAAPRADFLPGQFKGPSDYF